MNSELQLINDEIQKVKGKLNEKGYITARMLLEMPIYEMPYLWKPFFARTGLVGFVGSSDVGKSTFVRQLLLAVVAGESSFLGHSLNARYKRGIYVSTEDYVDDLSPILKQTQQELRLPADVFEGLIYIFHSEDLLGRLRKLLSTQPCDVIIIDSLTDIFGGKQINDVGQIRAFLNEYSELANEFGTLIIFLHHTSKRAEEATPSKHNSVGSQGFEAKVRTLIEFRRDISNQSLRHFCVVKGNYIPDEAKDKSYVLKFANRVFYATGQRIDFSELKLSEKDREMNDEILSLSEDGKSQREIANQLGINKNKVNRILKRLKSE